MTLLLLSKLFSVGGRFISFTTVRGIAKRQVAMSSSEPMSLDRFKGCLVGGVMGDCLGSPFEGDARVTKSVLVQYFKNMNDAHTNKNLPYKRYTDDTAMTFALCRSLLEKNALDLPNLAKHFAQEFIKDHRRGYGQAAGYLLSHLNKYELWKSSLDEDVVGPAKAQFDGQGSYGNGASMRVAPTALFHATDDTETLVKSAYRQSLITHSNGLGILGAIVQAAAVRLALQAEDQIDTQNFVTELKKIVTGVEGIQYDYKIIFVNKLNCISTYLTKTSIDEEAFLEDLGNDITAHGSVPTAIYAFLKALQPLSEFETSSGVIRSIFAAIRIGGDTDTIASMAGSIAGAYYGQKDITAELSRHCEGITTAEEFAIKMHARISP
ncbi:poly(ADP-ribose) glycohydrolase ARH3-like isoform X1 [Varroa jacobsoni]|uniref:ADP-ribosylhydrolase ARH3 n=1 Tax=Varroa destructor TaxID=109461 RepID=A0A7M7JFG9_VARDE|nr:poly(ADP-ribose) glycohydrolase ARH3-like isoform X2 [Varroa destructor]XP_022705231.1 poly(ADP-ribose) glycohydrolase ARH3-like isoform X1 [Varroa jacobsoni]